MRICYIANAGVIHTQRWLKFFSSAGHDIHLITDNYNPIEGVKIYDMRFRNRYKSIRYLHEKFLPYRVRVVKRLIDEIEPDIVHAHYVAKYGYRGALSGFHPLVLTAWGSDIYLNAGQSFLSNRLTIYSLTKADLITGDSKDLLRAMRKLSASEDKLVEVQWGVELDWFDSVEKTNWKRELGWDDDPVVISTRSFKHFYNIDVLLKAVPLVLKEFANAKFLILGSGPLEGELKQEAENLNLRDSVRFLGAIPYEKVPVYLKDSQVFISIPSWDGTSASLLEAMSARLPVIVTDLPTNREWIEEGVNGHLVPIRDEKRLAEAIVHLLKDKASCLDWGKRNRDIIEERADHKREMRKMEALYKSLIREK